MPVSPYLALATDGTDPGCHIANMKAQVAIAKSGDRRGAARALYAGSYEGCTYPTFYHSLTLPAMDGTVRAVHSSATLQAALDASSATAHDVVELDANGDYSGNFYLHAKAGADQFPGGNNVVTIRSSGYASLPYGLRIVGPEQAAELGIAATDLTLLARVHSPNNVPVFDTNNENSHGWRFIGLELDTVNTLTGSGNYIQRLVRLGDGNSRQNLDSLVPKNVCLDRCYIHGNTNQWAHLGVDWQVGQSYVIDCDFSDFHAYGTGDCQALLFYNTNGKLAVINSYFSAGDECIGHGGSDNNVGMLQDTEIRWNVFNKPRSWKQDDALYAGQPWQIKNSAEAKQGHRCLWEGNYHVHSWPGEQNGDLLLIKNDYTQVGSHITEHFVVRYNHFKSGGSGVRVIGASDGNPANWYSTRNVAVFHNLLEDVGGSVWDAPGGGGGVNQHGASFQMQATEGLRIGHNTVAGGSPRFYAQVLFATTLDTDGNNNSLVIRDNVFQSTTFSTFKTGGQSPGSSSLNAVCPGALLHGNVLSGDSSGNYSGTNHSGNYFPANDAAMVLNADYSLAGTTQTGLVGPYMPRMAVMFCR